MKNDLITLKNSLLTDNGDIRTTSLDVALHFKRKHFNVLRDIENLHCSNEFNQLNFEVSFKNNKLANNKRDKYYNMTRDGFTMLCMGYTGRKAMYWKELYIQAFNQLQQQTVDQSATIALLQHTLLTAKPKWQRIFKYKNLGLNHQEISCLVKLNVSTVRRNVRSMEACGLLQAPDDLASLQAMAARLRQHGA